MLTAKIMQQYAVDVEFEEITQQTSRIESIISAIMVLKEKSLTSKYLYDTDLARRCSHFLGHNGPVGAYRVAQNLGSPELLVNFIEKRMIAGFQQIFKSVQNLLMVVTDMNTRLFIQQWCEENKNRV